MGERQRPGAVTTARVARPWAARIDRADAAAAAALRLLPGVDAAVNGGESGWLWLRGPDLADAVDAALRCVPGIERFLVVSDGRLAEPGARVPSVRLPELDWAPVARVIGVHLPPPTIAGDRPASATLRVVRSTVERTPAAVLTTAVEWETWCSSAAEIRLSRLTFAACADGRVLVRGSPLPTIPTAVALWADAAILVPCGHAPEPDLAGESLRAVVGAGSGDIVLFGADGGFEIVAGDAFAPATRSAARLTRRSLVGG